MKNARILSFLLAIVLTASLVMSGCANLGNATSSNDDASSVEDSSEDEILYAENKEDSSSVSSEASNEYATSEYWQNVTTEGALEFSI